MPATIDGYRHEVLRQQGQRRWRAGAERPGRTDPLAGVRATLDAAHRELPAEELVEVLLALRRLAAPMAYGRTPARPPAPPPGAGAPTVGVVARTAEAALHAGARRMGPEALAAGWEALDALLHEVAARPSRSAVPVAGATERGPPRRAAGPPAPVSP